MTEKNYENELERAIAEEEEALKNDVGNSGGDNADADKSGGNDAGGEDAGRDGNPAGDAGGPDAPEDTPAEGEKQPVKSDDTQSPAEIARVAYENRELRRKYEEMQKKLADIEAREAEKAKAADAAKDPEPDKQEDPEAWLEWKTRQLEKRAAEIDARVSDVSSWREQTEKQRHEAEVYQRGVETFVGMVNEYRKDKPDFDDVDKFFSDRIREAVLLQYPTAQPEQIDKLAARQILSMASQFAREGKHPVDEMYRMAKERMGYKPSQPAEEKPKVDLAKQDDARKRSASGAAVGGGGSKPALTVEDASDMSLASFSKLSDAEQRRLLSGG